MFDIFRRERERERERGKGRAQTLKSRRLRMEYLESRELLSVTAIERAEIPELYSSAEFSESASSGVDAIDLSAFQSEANASGAVLDGTTSVDGETVWGQTYVVTTALDVVDPDDGVTSLREAASLATSSWDTITFAPSLKGETILLSGSQIEISTSITIDASALYDEATGTPGITIDAGKKSRVFYIGSGTADDPATLIGLTITGGYVSNDQHGGAIYVAEKGTLSVKNSTFTGNSTKSRYADGGAIHVDFGTLNVENSTFTGNAAGRCGGAISMQGYVGSNLIASSVFDGNTAGAWGGAISANVSDGSGAYLYGSGDGLAVLDDLEVKNNTASRGGGVFLLDKGALTNSTFTDNVAYDGGAICCDFSSTFSNITATGNVAKNEGGAIDCYASTLSNITATGNVAYRGGAINCGDSTLSNITATGNVAYRGGAICSRGTSTLTSGAIVGNVAEVVYTGTSNSYKTYAYGGGIYNYGKLTATNVTIAGNEARYSNVEGAKYVGAYGGGLYNAYDYCGSSATLRNVIIAENYAQTAGSDVYLESGTLDASRTLSTYEFENADENYAYDPNAPLFADVDAGDCRLAPNSQAIDKGDDQYAYDAGLTGDSLDLAGKTRFVGDSVDLGAYEYQAPIKFPTDVKFGDYDASTKTATLTWTDNAPDEVRYEIQSSTDGGEWRSLPDLPANTTSRVCYGLSQGSVYVYRVRAVAADGTTSAWESATLDLTTPAAPTNVRFGGYDDSANTATLIWADNATIEVRYEIQSSTNGGEWRSLSDLAANETSRICHKLLPGNVYVYRVRAVSADGKASAWASATLDLTPPAVPADVKFDDYDVSAKTATLAWADDETREVRYEIQSSTNGGEWTALADLDADATSLACSDLLPGNVYVYRVRAVSAEGVVSAWASATLDLTIPADPTDVKFGDYDASTKTATLTWTDNAPDEVRYEIQSSTDGGEWRSLPDLPANTTSRVCSGLRPGNVYVYRVRAVSAEGVASAWVSATIAPIAAPTNVKLSDYNPLTKRATLTWTDDAAREVWYEIQSSTNGGEWTALSDLPANTTSRVCYGLATGNVYVYRIRAVAKGGAASAWVSATIAPIAAPTNVTFSDYNVSTKRATLTWTDNATNEVRYEIQSSTNGGEWTALSNLPADTTSRICYGLAAENVYAYRVRAVSADGTASAWVSATIAPASAPADAEFSDYDASTKRATLSWTDNATDEVRYEIQSSTNGGEWTALADLPADATSRVCYGLAAENVYAYRVRAVSADGTTSAWVSAKIAPSTTPTNVTFSDYDASTKRATLSWTDNATDEVRYEIQSSTNGGEWKALSNLAAGATSRVCYGLAAENVYAYRVRAVSADGTATAWVSAKIAPSTTPTNVKIVDYDASTKRATLSWTDNATDEVRYEIQSSTNGGEWKALSNLAANATSRICYSLALGNVYVYRIRAVAADGTTSAWASATFDLAISESSEAGSNGEASVSSATLASEAFANPFDDFDFFEEEWNFGF